MDWISHVKQYQAEHAGMSYREAMKGAKNTWKKGKKQQGDGFISNAINKIKQKAKEGWFFPANKLPGNSQSVFNKYQNATIEKIMVNRAPVNSGVEKGLNFLSLGTYEKAKKSLGYDKMFHLSMVLFTNKGRIAVQKNERISIATGGSGGGESIDIAYPRRDTVGDFLGKAQKAMGDHHFFQYNAFENNCQDFIIGCLKANGVLSESARKFIKQDAETLLKKMPGYISKIAQAATDLAGKASEIVTGQGKKRRKRKKSCGCEK